MKINIFNPIDNAPLVIFRVLFGFLIACESFGAIATGWVKRTLIETNYSFPFIGFDWLQPLPKNGMYFYFVLMGICGLLIMLGYRYLIAMIGFTILWSGVYFMQKTAYNNHYYLLMLISFLMLFMPANKDFSLDSKLKYTTNCTVMPRWVSLTFIAQLFIVYTFAAIAKFYPDWLDGTFTKNLLNGVSNKAFLIDLFAQKWFYLFIAYAGIFFDLLIVPFLLYKKTRTIALIASLVFHLFNAITLQIGIFPFFALSFSLFFYKPTHIRNLFLKKWSTSSSFDSLKFIQNKKIVYFLIIPFLIIQFLLPLRHHLIEGDVLWTEEGHRMSWRMMLRERSGFIHFKIIDNDTKQEIKHIPDDISPKVYNKLATHPDFIWQYCQILKKKYDKKNISIFIDCKNSINRKEYFTLIDPNFDMAKAKWDYFWHNEWVLLQNH